LVSYELTLIFDPNLGEENISAILTKIEDKIKSLGGKIQKTDKWGTRRLASMMRNARKLTQGYYVLIFFKAETSLPAPLKAYLKVTENLLRYVIIRAEEKAPVEKEEKGSTDEILAVNVGEIKETKEQSGQS